MSQENNFIPSQDGYKPLTPFRLFVKSNFPFIENTYESLDNYGLYCKIVEYLNTLIENENTVESNVESLYNAFVSLNNYVSDYFDNLDVQDEINNKLDELVENGTLESIFEDYLSEFRESITRQIINIDNKVDAAASGSPAGTYSTLADLQAANPDHTRIYIVTSNGHWYYWNSVQNDWADGGAYQSTGIADNSIDSDKINNVSYRKVFDKFKTYDLNNTQLYGTGTRTINSDGSVSINRSDISANVGVLIPINNIDINKDLLFKIKISNAKAILLFTYNSANANFGFNNGEYYCKLKKQYLSAHSTLSFRIYANEYVDATGDVFTINSFEYTQDDTDLLQKFEEPLSTNINKLSEKYAFNDIKDFRDNIFDEEIYNTSIINKFGFPSRVQIDKSTHTILIGKKTNSAGVEFGKRFTADKYLHIKGKVTTLNSGNSIRVFLNNHKNNNTTEYISVATITSTGDFDIKVDLSYYAVYSDMNYCTVILTDNTQNSYFDFIIENLDIFKTDIEDLEIYSNNLGDIIRNIQNKFDGISKSKDVILTSPNGTSYKLLVNNDGTLATKNIVYNKALFIGNSLLLGFGTHGMASTNVNTDYYHYTVEGCTEKNENFTASKIRGSLFEQALSTADLQTFYNTVLDAALDSNTDLVFIQLGDNNNTSERKAFLQTSAPDIINHIKSIVPNASIYWVGVWYNTDNLQTINNACINNGATLINISGLNTTNNQNYVGATYIDENGVEQIITDPGVASHPSDRGMKAIADTILSNIF